MYHNPNGLTLRKALCVKDAKTAAGPKAPKGRPLSKRENNAKQYRFNVRLVRRALKLDAAYKEMSDADKSDTVANLQHRYQMLKDTRDKFMKVYPKMNWEMKELNRKHNRFVDGKCFLIGFLQGKLIPNHKKMYNELENTPYKEGLSSRVSENDTDDENAIYLEVRKAIRTAELGAGQAAGGQAAGGDFSSSESSSSESSGGEAAGGKAAVGSAAGGKAGGGKAAAEEASADEEAAEDDTAIYVSSSPAPVRMRQKRKANVPDGVYILSRPMPKPEPMPKPMPKPKPKHKPRKWVTRMKNLKK